MKYTETCHILEDVVDNETNWYYLHNLDHRWSHLKDCWDISKHVYFEHVLNKNVVVTAGGHIGLYVRFYSKIFKKVYAFEPNPESFFCMVNNAPTENVIKIQAALGDSNKLISLEGPCSLSLQAKEDRQDAFIPMFTIDSLALNECDLLQLDVENHEYKALLGAKNTIKKCHPFIILENGDTEEIKSLMSELKYKHLKKVHYDDFWIYDGETP